MAVQNIECQIALGQMIRYLSGDALAKDVESELKAHIAKCPECSEALERRKALLQAMAESEARAAMPPEVRPRLRTPFVNLRPEKPDAAFPTQAVVQPDAVRSESGTDSPLPMRRVLGLGRYGKPIGYLAALGAVLLGMSLVMRDPTRLFGDRAVSGASFATPQDPQGAPNGVQEPGDSHEGSDFAPQTTGFMEPPRPRQGSDAASVAQGPSIVRVVPKAPSTPPPSVDIESRQTGSGESVRRVAKSASTRPRTTSRPQPRRQSPRASGLIVYDPIGNPIR